MSLYTLFVFVFVCGHVEVMDNGPRGSQVPAMHCIYHMTGHLGLHTLGVLPAWMVLHLQGLLLKLGFNLLHAWRSTVHVSVPFGRVLVASDDVLA